jgi:hypothetical protein
VFQAVRVRPNTAYWATSEAVIRLCLAWEEISRITGRTTPMVMARPLASKRAW